MSSFYSFASSAVARQNLTPNRPATTPHRSTYKDQQQRSVREYYSTKEALLAAIKARLQIVYDAHRITRQEFVAIAKNTFRILAQSETVNDPSPSNGGLLLSEVPVNAFMASWNDQFVDTALKLQLELLGIMWPPVLPETAHTVVNTPIQNVSAALSHTNQGHNQHVDNGLDTPLGKLAGQRTRPPSPPEPSHYLAPITKLPLQPTKTLHPLLADECREMEDKEAYFRSRVAEAETTARTGLQGSCLTKALSLFATSSSRSASVNIDYQTSGIVEEPSPPTSSPPQTALNADMKSSSPPPSYKDFVFSSTPRRPTVTPPRLTPEGLRSLYQSVRLTPALNKSPAARAPRAKVSAKDTGSFADPYAILPAVKPPAMASSRSGSVSSSTYMHTPRPAMPTTHYPTRDEVVEHVRALLQPAYNTGLLPPQSFAAVVRYVSQELDVHGLPRGFGWQDVVALHVKAGCSAMGIL